MNSGRRALTLPNQCVQGCVGPSSGESSKPSCVQGCVERAQESRVNHQPTQLRKPRRERSWAIRELAALPGKRLVNLLPDI